jgi:hypothetical protein
MMAKQTGVVEVALGQIWQYDDGVQGEVKSCVGNMVRLYIDAHDGKPAESVYLHPLDLRRTLTLVHTPVGTKPPAPRTQVSKTGTEVLDLVRKGVNTRKALAAALGIPQSSLNGRVKTLVKAGKLVEFCEASSQLSNGRGPYILELPR